MHGAPVVRPALHFTSCLCGGEAKSYHEVLGGDRIGGVGSAWKGGGLIIRQRFIATLDRSKANYGARASSRAFEAELTFITREAWGHDGIKSR